MEQAIKFESVIILIPDITKEQKQEVITNCKNLMDNENTQVKEIGTRQLAYEISGNKKGLYIQFNYKQAKSNIDKIENYFRKDDKILKFITIEDEEV